MYLGNFPWYTIGMGRVNTTFKAMMGFAARANGDEHWLRTQGERDYVSDPRGGPIVTLSTGIYATFVAPVPQGFVAKSSCGVVECLRPKHLCLVSSNGRRKCGVDMRGMELEYERAHLPWVEPK